MIVLRLSCEFEDVDTGEAWTATKEVLLASRDGELRERAVAKRGFMFEIAEEIVRRGFEGRAFRFGRIAIETAVEQASWERNAGAVARRAAIVPVNRGSSISVGIEGESHADDRASGDVAAGGEGVGDRGDGSRVVRLRPARRVGPGHLDG